MPGRHARAGHDGRRCRQAQRAGAGDDQHRHGADQRRLQPHADPQPAQQRDQGNHDHRGHEHRRHLVHQPLYRRLGGLGVLHQADDARQHRLGAHGRHLHHNAAIAVDRPARELPARLAQHGQGLAGQHGLVHLGVALMHQPVHRNALARAHHQSVTGHDLGDGHVHLAVAREQMRHLGPQRVQRANRRRGLALGTRLQPLAQQHQGDDHGRGLEVQVRRMARLGRPPQPQRQAIARAGAYGHQQIHVAGQRAGRMPAGLVETRTQPELHRRRQQELRPGRQHPMLAEQIAEHGQHQRRRQQQADGHRHEAGPGRLLQRLAGVLLGGAARLVAGVAHGAAQHGVHAGRSARVIDDMGALGRQVHRGVLHAGHLAQGALHAAHAAGTGHAAHAQVQRLRGCGG